MHVKQKVHAFLLYSLKRKKKKKTKSSQRETRKLKLHPIRTIGVALRKKEKGMTEQEILSSDKKKIKNKDIKS